ncbi:MAG: pilus assembly protein TadG-related protein [Bryobacterales bacterium]
MHTRPRAIYDRPTRKGQALTIFAVSLLLLLGVMALAIEVGWARYVRKQAQSAADAGALAAAVAAFRADSTSDWATQTLTDCPSSGNLDVGCDYAEANGFSPGGDSGRQSVKIAGGTGAAPNVPGVPADYWVQVEASHNLPQMFSGVIARSGLAPKATATAAIRNVAADASMYLLNRKDDCFVAAAGLGLVCGEDFLGIGGNYINAPMGIYMASSNGRGLGLPNISAGTVLGLMDVDSPFTYLMGNGAINPLLGLGAINWETTNGFPDGEMFVDPMAGKPQPPAPTESTDPSSAWRG